MAATPYPSRSLARPSHGRLEAGLATIGAELAFRPHRLRGSIRAAAIGVVAAGLMAAAHVDSPLGPYFVWLLAGTPRAMMKWRTAFTFTVVIGATLSLALIFGRALSQSPPLMLTTIALFGAVSTYLINRFNYGAFGLIIQVLVLDNFYAVIFAPDQVGWGASATFGGIAIGMILIALSDNWLWPDPAEPILLEFIAEDLRRLHRRLRENTQIYLAPTPTSMAKIEAHEMAPKLALLARAQAEGLTERGRAIYVAALTALSRLRSQVNALAAAANNEQVPRDLRQLAAPAIRDAVDGLAGVLAALVANPETILRTRTDDAPNPVVERMLDGLAALDARVVAIRPLYLAGDTGATELANFSVFLSGLRNIGRLLERPLDSPAPAEVTVASSSKPASLDPALVRYSIKVAIALVIGYVVGLTTQRSDLSTILTTIIITALPTYGAAAGKMVLRLAGAILGGLAVIAMVIIVTPNFDTVPVYMMVLFIPLVVSGYAGESGRTAYAGKQLGTTVMLAFAGINPAVAVEPPLWRVWGILLGTAVVLVIATFLWPEYAGDSLPPRLRRLMKLTLDLAPGAVADRHAILRIDAELTNALEQSLAIADDARIEGRLGQLNADAVVQTAGTLRRIAHRFEGIALGRISYPRPPLDATTEDAARRALDPLVAQLQAWLAWIDSPSRLANRPPATVARASMEQAVGELTERIEADRFARLAGWSVDQRRTLLAELSSLHRLTVLFGELDEFLARITRAAS